MVCLKTIAPFAVCNTAEYSAADKTIDLGKAYNKEQLLNLAFQAWKLHLQEISAVLKSTLLFQTCQKQSTYIRAQLEIYCILFELVLLTT